MKWIVLIKNFLLTRENNWWTFFAKKMCSSYNFMPVKYALIASGPETLQKYKNKTDSTLCDINYQSIMKNFKQTHFDLLYRD